MLSTSPITNAYNVMQTMPSSSCDPSTQIFQPDLSYNCIVCGDINENPNDLYEHMRQHHSEMYEPSQSTEAYDVEDDDSDDFDIDDEKYSDLSRLLEPICEIHQLDEDLVMTPIPSETSSQHTELKSIESTFQQNVVLRKCV